MSDYIPQKIMDETTYPNLIVSASVLVEATLLNRSISQIRVLLGACRELEADCNRLPELL